MPHNLTGHVIVITGASSGIGAATAVECAKAGMDLVLNARRVEKLQDVAARVKDLGRRVVLVEGDVTDNGLSAGMLDAAEQDLGRCDVVFANAGHGMTKVVVEESQDDLRRIFEVNFFAGVELLKLAARRFIERKQPGHLLMCSSCVSKFSLPRHGAYAATKAAQNAVCSAMRLECARHSIHVSSVHPITTTTEFFDVSAKLSGTEAPGGGAPKHSPSMFVQSPERVARAIVKCLRKPRPEVWTSHIVRTMAGVGTVFPRFGDWMIRSQARKDGAE